RHKLASVKICRLGKQARKISGLTSSRMKGENATRLTGATTRQHKCRPDSATHRRSQKRPEADKATLLQGEAGRYFKSANRASTNWSGIKRAKSSACSP